MVDGQPVQREGGVDVEAQEEDVPDRPEVVSLAASDEAVFRDEVQAYRTTAIPNNNLVAGWCNR